MAKIQNPQNEKGETLATNKLVEDSFTKGFSGDQYIKIKTEKDAINDRFTTSITANIIESQSEDAENKLITSSYLKKVEETLDKKISEHKANNDIHLIEGERTRWNDTIQGISGDEYISVTTVATDTDDINEAPKKISTIALNSDKIATTIGDIDSTDLVNEGSLIKYIDDTQDENGNIIQEGILSTWHAKNEYSHISKYIPDALNPLEPDDNRYEGTECKGFVMKLPNFGKLRSISLISANVSAADATETEMIWSNYYVKILDPLTREEIAKSQAGEYAAANNNELYKYPCGEFNFESDQQKYYDAEREYYVLFYNIEDNSEATIKLAYANGNGNYQSASGYIFGKLTPKVILENNSITSAPVEFNINNSESVPCSGYACDYLIDIVKSEELNHLSLEIKKLASFIETILIN